MKVERFYNLLDVSLRKFSALLSSLWLRKALLGDTMERELLGGAVMVGFPALPQESSFSLSPLTDSY